MSKEQEHIEAELKRLKSEQQSLEAQLLRTESLILARRSELIALTCPYKVGQRLSTRKGEFEIASITPHSYGKDDAYDLKGRLVLSDGRLHKAERMIYEWDLKVVNQ